MTGSVGKTTVTANLGTAIAQLGFSVVVVDADIGLRNLDVVMGLENRIVYHVVDAIRGKRSVGAVIRERMPRSVQMVALFTFTAYGVWVMGTAIYRDTIVAELLASLLLVVGMGMALRGAKHRDLLIGVACIAVVALIARGSMAAASGVA